MRPLKSHFPAHALTTVDTMLKQTKEARVFRRAQAVLAVVAGHHVSAVSATFHVANAARRTWVQRCAHEGAQGLLDRPRSGRPSKVTCELEQLSFPHTRIPWTSGRIHPLVHPDAYVEPRVPRQSRERTASEVRQERYSTATVTSVFQMLSILSPTLSISSTFGSVTRQLYVQSFGPTKVIDA